MIDPWLVLSEAGRSRPGSPLITWYGSDSTRTELSVVSFTNAVAKTAGFLRDELLLEPTELIRLQLGLHWQTPVWITASAIVGARLELTSHSQEADPANIIVGFDSASIKDSDAEYKVIVSDHPMGLPGPQIDEPFVDHARESMSQPDALVGGDDDYANFQILDDQATYDSDQIVEQTTKAAERWGVEPGQTLLSTVPPSQPDGWLACWAVPLFTGCHVVMCAPRVDVASVAALERATVILPVPGELSYNDSDSGTSE